MARVVQVTEMVELAMDEPNLYHIQESYLRQIAHSHPLTACKQRKSDVKATSAKWFRQKGTGRARQGELTNPHMRGGGLAFAPKPRKPHKRLNKHVRQSALRSAVLLHLQNQSVHVIQGQDFDTIAKTKDVAELLSKVTTFETICLVISRDMPVCKAARNIWNIRLIDPEFVNVRDVIESGQLVFSQEALDKFRIMMLSRIAGGLDEEAEAAAMIAVDEPDGGES